MEKRSVPVDIPATKKANRRTPLHYAARNGCLEAAKLLVELGADVNARAKHGVSPFQLAVWQNNLDICRWLVEEHGVDPLQLNDFDCGAVHWIGICPQTRAEGILALAKWLNDQNGIDFHQRQRQGHTPLHKAAWGGHLALIRYLRDEHGLMDDVQDYAGNYAADLSDMANTERHSEVAQFLRRECNAARAQSCSVLGVPLDSSVSDIRKAYLAKAREAHPDRRNKTNTTHDFDAIHKAYEHLTLEGGTGSQCNPAHSLNLMLELSKTPGDKAAATAGVNESDDGDCFKARLIAVLLEYGDKGLDLCNIKKKWAQVWPNVPFPDETKVHGGVKRKGGGLTEFIRLKAGDIVDFVVLPSGGKGSIRVIPKHCTQTTVAQYASGQRDESCNERR